VLRSLADPFGNELPNGSPPVAQSAKAALMKKSLKNILAPSASASSCARDSSGAHPVWWKDPVWLSLGLYAGILLALFAATFRMYIWWGHEQLFMVQRIWHLSDLWKAQGPFHAPWFPEVCYGYGWPFFTFYAPLGYYVGAAGHLLFGLNYGASARWSFYLATALSGLFMYGLVWILGGREGWPRRAWWALTAATVYVLAPYHLTDLFARTSLAECWAWAALPVLFCAIEICRTRPVLGVMLVAPAYAMLMLSHNISALYGTVLTGAYVLLTSRSVAFPLRVGLGGAIGAAMSSYYWFAAMRLLPLVKAGDVRVMWGSPKGLRDMAVFLKQHLVETPGRGLSVIGARDDLGINLGLVILGGCVLAFVALFQSGWGRGARARVVLLLSFIVIFVFAMSPWMPWERVPALFRYVQFPWRMLVFTSFLGALLWAAASPVVDRWVHPLLVAAAAVLIGIPGAYRYLVVPAEPALSDKTLLGWYAAQEQTRRLFAGCALRDYKPHTAKEHFTDYNYIADNLPPKNRLEVIEGNLEVRAFKHKGVSYHYECAATTNSLARVHVFFFPGWTVRINGVAAPERLSCGEDGLVNLRLPPGNHTVFLQYELSPVGRAARTISRITWAAWGLLAVGLVLRRRMGRSPPA
jgi:hypothetical protein